MPTDLCRHADWAARATLARFDAAPHRLAALSLLVALLAAVPASAKPPAGQTRASRLAALLAGHKKATIGLVVRRLDSGKIEFAQNADTPLKPASVLKLFTTAAALERFGPTFALTTRAYLDGPDLLIVGGGNPGLGDARLAKRHGREHLYEFRQWIDALHARGVRTIRKVAIDDAIFEPLSRHPDWPDDQADKWYQAPVAGIVLNDNCIDARVRAAGGKVTLLTTPHLPPELLRNSAVAAKKQHLRLHRALGTDIFELSGTAAHDADLGSIACGQPAVFVGYAVRQALVEAGIPVTAGIVRRTTTPSALQRATLLATHRTAMPELIWRTNKYSQNLFAECLFKSLAAYGPDGHPTGQPGSWDAARPILRRTLESLGLDTRGAVFRDGSGLSHGNRVSAAQVAALLAIMDRHRQREVFLASLAEPGQEGSMRRRYADPALRGHLRGKTGSISGVRSLAGIIERDDGTRLAFALLINGTAPLDLPTRVTKAILSP